MTTTTPEKLYSAKEIEYALDVKRGSIRLWQQQFAIPRPITTTPEYLWDKRGFNKWFAWYRRHKAVLTGAPAPVIKTDRGTRMRQYPQRNVPPPGLRTPKGMHRGTAIAMMLGITYDKLRYYMDTYEDTPPPTTREPRRGHAFWDDAGKDAWVEWYAKHNATGGDVLGRIKRRRSGRYSMSDIARELNVERRTVSYWCSPDSDGLVPPTPEPAGRNGRGWAYWDEEGLQQWREWHSKGGR